MLRDGVISSLPSQRICPFNTNFCIPLPELLRNLLVLCSTSTSYTGYTSSSKISDKNLLMIQKSLPSKTSRSQSTLQHSVAMISKRRHVQSLQPSEPLYLTFSLQTNKQKYSRIFTYWAGFIYFSFLLVFFLLSSTVTVSLILIKMQLAN